MAQVYIYIATVA